MSLWRRRNLVWCLGALAGAFIFGGFRTRAQAVKPCSLCLWGPDNLAIDRAGNVYLGDSDGHGRNRILKFSPAGKVLGDFRVFAPGDGPDGLAFTPDGELLVADRGGKSILRLSKGGRKLGTFGPRGGFPALGHIVVTAGGAVVVAQAALNRIERYSATGKLEAAWPEAGDPQCMVLLPGNVLAIDTWRLAHITLTSLSGQTVGTIKEDRVRSTAGDAGDAAGHLYQADWHGHQVAVYEAGVFQRMITNTPDNHLFEQGPYSLAMDPHGHLWAADGLSVVEFTPEGKLLAHLR